MRRTASKATRAIARVTRRADARSGRPVPVFMRLERLVAFAAVAAVAVFVCIYVYHMATTSLWHDELYSVQHFSSRGIWNAVSNYHVPNNHIFFNVLNALTPTADPYEPLAARLWSFVAVLACLAVAAPWLFRQGLHLEAVVFSIAVFANAKNLDLMSQARGYGLAACFAVLGAILTHRYLESGSTRAIASVATTTVLGTWTVPAYLGFAGPLMLCAFLFRRRWNALVAGGLTIMCIGALHLPVLRQIADHLAGFGDTWGRAFSSWAGIGESAADYIVSGIDPAWALAALASILTLALFLPGTNADATNATRRALAISVATFYAGCLVLESPLVRSTQFTAGPVALLGALVLSTLLGQLPGALRPLARGALLASAIVLVVDVLTSFTFTAKQSWRETAHFVEAVFPSGIEVAVPSRKRWLDVYIDPRRRTTTDIDTELFARGRQVVVSDRYLSIPEEQRFRGRVLANAAVEVPIRQRDHGYQLVSWARPVGDPFLESVDWQGAACACKQLTDGNPSTGRALAVPLDGHDGLSIRLVPRGGQSYKAVVLGFSMDSSLPIGLHAVLPGGEFLPLTRVRVAGPWAVAELPDTEIESVDLRLDPTLDTRGAHLAEVWFYANTPRSETR